MANRTPEQTNGTDHGKSTKARKTSNKAASRPGTFDDVIAGAAPVVGDTARHLRALVTAALPDAAEGIYGGASVRIALYSHGGPNHVVCGIQPSGPRCLFYLHRINPEDAPELNFAGKGKHARHLEFTAPTDIPGEAITRLVLLSAERLESGE